MKIQTEHWLHSADSDLLLISKIIEQEELTHLAAFHAQQAIEKLFKAIIEEFNLEFVKIHALETLYQKVKDRIHIENPDLLIILDQLYIDARYPGEFGLLPNGKPSLEESSKFFDLAIYISDSVKNACK